MEFSYHKFEFKMSEEEELCDAVEARRYSKAYSLLRKLKEPLKEEYAGRCLSGALLCTSKLFGEVLRNCVPGEYNGNMRVTLGETGCECNVNGNLLMLAAAADQTEHMQLLLDQGYDVNSASLAAAQAEVENRGFFHRGSGFEKEYCGVKSNSVVCHPKGDIFEKHWHIDGCTPLAAAIVCGSTNAVELLLKQPGVWSRESSSVCRAAMAVMGNEEYWRQKDCILQVFPLKDPFSFLAPVENILDEWHFPLCAVGDLCSAKQLARMLKSGLYTEEDGRAMLRKMEQQLCQSNKKEFQKKLLLLARSFPKLCKEPWAKGIFLRCYLRMESPEDPCTKLLNCWKKLSGKVGDLTMGLGGEDWRQPLQFSDLRRALPALKEGMDLVVDADALHSAWSARELEFITKHVRLVRTPGLGGVSGYAARLLLGSNPKQLGAAVKRGYLAGETKLSLLEFTHSHKCNPGLRHVILSMEQQEQQPVPLPEHWSKDPKWEYCKWWDTELVWEKETDGKTWLSQLWESAQTKEETERRYGRYKTTINAQRYTLDREVVIRHPKSDIEVEDSIMDTAVCGENPALLEVLLEEHPERIYQSVNAQLINHALFDRLEATTMTMAAALGRIGQMKVLLKAGYDPNEEGRGAISILCYHGIHHGRAGVAVSPALAALLMAEEEALRLLLEAGAKLDCSEGVCYRALMAAGSAEALELAARVPGIGYEKLTEKERTALQYAQQARERQED